MIHAFGGHRPIGMGLMMAALAFVSTAVAADLKLNRNFTNDMVVQRDLPAVIKGTADKGVEVTVSFAGQTQTAKADEAGNWQAVLKAMKANAAPQTLTVSTKGCEPIELSNIVIGDVFLVARQTSIDIALGSTTGGKDAAARHRPNSNLRAISINTIASRHPRADLAGEATVGWTVVAAKEALKMNAAAYYLGRDLAAKSGVPVGIIDLNMGSAFPVSWLSREDQLASEKFYGKRDVIKNLERMETLADLVAKGEPRPRKESIVSDPLAFALFPAGGHNAVLNPLKGLAIKAALLQVGNDYPYMIYAGLEEAGTRFDREELNRAYAETYAIRKNGFRMEPVTVPRIPHELRKVFGKDLQIGLITTPGSDLNTLGQHHREMRELHRQMAEDDPNTSIILPGSDNLPFSAQPEDETLVAQRCLNWVLGDVYKEAGVAATGPLFDRVEASFNKATVYFKKGTAEELKAQGDALNYFEAAGPLGDYSPAEAVIDGEVIRIKSNTVTRITRVRYNWNHRPNQGLVNAAGLPAVPFRSKRENYHWFVRNEDSDLPEEYSTPANEWKKSDVTLINGQLKNVGYDNFTGWLGPIGVKTGPFGPNMGVTDVLSGSPADGKLFVDDVIYSANGKMLGKKAWVVMAAAITDSETHEKGGKLLLGVRRGAENLDIELKLKVMGTYSPTAPYDCPKTEAIITGLEDWVISRGAGKGYLSTNALFMLATGNPRMQGYVRRIVYDIISNRDPNGTIDPLRAGKSWFNSAEAMLLGEYFLATGDRAVLPYMKHACDRLAATQHELGGWRHNFPGGPHYGLIPNCGVPGVIGMNLAMKSGVDINMKAYKRGLQHFAKNRAETGYLIYGFGEGCEREVPVSFNPHDMEEGHLETYNGGLSAAGILMGLAGKHHAAKLCSLISAFAWNNTFHGHGGNQWNNFWTPLGAHQHGKGAFLNFWQNYRWYRESNRMFNGSLIINQEPLIGAGPGVALVAPRRRIQIVGAPKSPFAADALGALKPALAAYWAKDYKTCATLADALITGGTVGLKDIDTVKYLARQARDIQESIRLDLDRVKALIDAGKLPEAKTDLLQLQMVMSPTDERLAAIAPKLKNVERMKLPRIDKVKVNSAPTKVDNRKWQCLVSEASAPQERKPVKGPVAAVPAPAPANWTIMVVEDLKRAPKGWCQPTFDDSTWKKTQLPISWHMYHTALLRTTFNVDDKDAFDALRFRAWLFRQQGIEIYLNGELVGKVNNLEKRSNNIDNVFKESALKHLKTGENTLAVTTRHNWRWGQLNMFVYNNGFDFNLDASLKKK